MDRRKDSAQVQRLEVVDVGRRRRWSAEAKLRIVGAYQARGDYRNALELKKEKEILREGKKSKQLETLTILQKDLQLTALPLVIECFDNSNFQGTSPVASMVRFVNAKADKKNYRHFNIKTVSGLSMGCPCWS